MELNIVPADFVLPVERAYTLSIVIKSFKGRKDVEVHLFRPQWEESEESGYDWDKLLGDPVDPDVEISLASSRAVLMEAFTEAERDMAVEYLKSRYGDKLDLITSCPLNFPIPLGLVALSELVEGKSVGFIMFDRMPNYTLPFGLKGYFDLSRHKPIIEGQE